MLSTAYLISRIRLIRYISEGGEEGGTNSLYLDFNGLEQANAADISILGISSTIPATT